MKFDRTGVQKLLKHRDPFLFIDELTITSETTIEGKTLITPHKTSLLRGHFPNDPILPGVITIEAISQLGGILTFKPYLDQGIFSIEGIQCDIYLVKITDFVIKDSIRPDCQMDITATVTPLPMPNFFEVKGHIHVQNKLKARGPVIIYSKFTPPEKDKP
ncbi:MAG: hypothetical protein AAB276_05775 [Pseudomonadota bacterium]